MRGYIGTSTPLDPGDIVATTGHQFRVLREATLEEARASAASLGHSLVPVPGEIFYEIETVTVPVSPAN